MKAALLVMVLLLLAAAAPQYSGTGPEPVVEARFKSDREIVEESYSRIVESLFLNMYDKMATNPPEDEIEASNNFRRGVGKAKYAKALALHAIGAEGK